MKAFLKSRAFTLVEVLVAVAVVLLVGALTMAAIGNSQAVASRTRCMNDLKLIGQALREYYMEFQCYPSSYQEPAIEKALAKYIDHESVFACPNEQKVTGGLRRIAHRNWFYVEPVEAEAGSRDFVLGCPYHGDDSVNLFSSGNVEVFEGSGTMHNGVGMAPGQLAIGGVIEFKDGSYVNFEGHQCANLMQSFKDTSAGVTWDVIRILPGELGTAHFHVAECSGLIVITCVARAVAVVHGGSKPIDFDITTSDPSRLYTMVTEVLTQGTKVRVIPHQEVGGKPQWAKPNKPVTVVEPYASWRECVNPYVD